MIQKMLLTGKPIFFKAIIIQSLVVKYKIREI